MERRDFDIEKKETQAKQKLMNLKASIVKSSGGRTKAKPIRKKSMKKRKNKTMLNKKSKSKGSFLQFNSCSREPFNE